MKYLTSLSVLLLSIFLIVFVYLFNRQKKNLTISKEYNEKLTDSVNKYKANTYYLNNLWKELRDNHDLKLENGSQIYKLENSSKIRVKLNSLIDNNKLLVIRYTQIGCNACVDSTFKLLKKYRNLDKYKIITLVDFDNEEYYVKWRKISEFEGDVYWLRKGDIKFPVEQGNNSYIFTLDNGITSKSLFIPNSNQIYLLKEYLRSL